MLEIYLLGRFSIRIDGRDVPHSNIEGRKARSLLKLVALQRNCQLVRDRAMDVLWPSLAPDSAAAQLYKATYHIRKAFSGATSHTASPASDASSSGSSGTASHASSTTSPDELIEMSDDMIRLCGDAETDVQRFESASSRALESKGIPELEYAASLYAGDLLPMDLYSDWTQLPREHLRQLYLDVLLALGRRYQSGNRFAHAAETYRLALEKDPLLETAHRNLMRVFALQGQTTRAMRQFETCRRLLMDELDAEPEPTTLELCESIRENRVGGPARATESVSPLSLPPLVNRVEECGFVEAAFDRLAAGQGGAIAIEGAAGVGKTRFAQELAARARRRGFQVLTGRAREMEGAVSYGPFIEMLTAAVRDRPDAESVIPQEIARSIPGLAGKGEPVPNADRKAAQAYLFAEIKAFFQRFAAPVPAVLVIEDLHAADEGTIELLHFLWRQTRDVPLLVAATIRSDHGDATEHVRRMYRSIETEAGISVLALEPLDEQDHLVLLEHLSGRPDLPDEFVDSVYGLSEGNPLFAVELYRFHSGNGAPPDLPVVDVAGGTAAKSPVPPSLAAAVAQRLQNLSAGARHLLYLMAVLGREIEFDVLDTAWAGGDADGKDGGDSFLFDLLDELRTAGLVDEQGLQYHFRHAIVRASVYQSISEARRIALHKLAARSLLSQFPDEETAPVEQVAFHFARAGDGRQAAHYLTLAGRRAAAVYAHEDALRCFREALDVLEGDDDSVVRRTLMHLNRSIGDVYRASGRLEQSFDAYERALELAAALHLSRAERADLHMKIALVAIFRTEMDRSERHLDAAAALVDDDVAGRAHMFILRALHLWHLNRLEDAYEKAREALDIAEAAGATTLASQACEILAMACLPMGRWEEGLAYEKRRQVYGWSPEIVVATDAHLCLWEYHVAGDQPLEKATAFIRGVSEEAERLGDYRCVAVCHYALGTMHLWRGDSDRAGNELDASMELHERVGSPAGMAYSLARKAVMLTMDGALDAGWEAVREGIDQANRAAVRDHCLQRLYGVGLWNRLEAGDGETLRLLVEECEGLIDETPPCSACALELFPWLAYHYLRSGQVARAEACARTTREFAEATGNPLAGAISSMVLSTVEAARGDHGAATELRNEALQIVDDMVVQQARSPVTHFVDRMIDQQREFQLS